MTRSAGPAPGAAENAGLIEALDHVVVAVADLDAAAATYEKLLGRRSSWRGSHSGTGTCNVLFKLDNMYVELLCPTGEGLLGEIVRRRLEERGEGLMALAFATADADRFRTAMKRSGVETGQPISGEGRDEATDAVRRWRNVVLPGTATRGVLVFAIQHLSPPGALPVAEPVGVLGASVSALDHVVVLSTDADASRAVYGDLLGLRLALDRSFEKRGVRLVFFRVAGVTVEIAASLQADQPVERDDDLWGLAYRVADLEATAARLTGDGFDLTEVRDGHKPGTRVCTVRKETHGVATLVIGPAE
jgi:catechol 2,3-dioxygenase-like lactoylglutathione lyase family enzyme